MSVNFGASSLTSVQVGSRLGKYVILSELGRGGMAVVFKAHQPDLDRVVAIKVLFGSVLQQRFVERFQTEARSVAKLNHPNVIRIFEVGEQGGVHYLVMEHIQGFDLLAYLHEKKPSFNEVVEIVNQLAEALAYCHHQGIIHRDLKPTNVLMRGNTPIVIDFGLAKAVDPELNVDLTLSGEVIGSPAYMSPEQAQGLSAGTQSDICSLGILMYELISFKNPYLDPRSLHQTALNAIKAEPVPLRYLTPWLDADFAAIVNTCLAKELIDRYQDIDLVLKDLYSYRNGLPIMAKPPSNLNLAWRFVKANPILYLGTGFLILICSLIYTFISIEEGSKKAPWGLVQEVNFSKTDSSMLFSSFDKVNNAWTPSSSWKVDHGQLNFSGMRESYSVANQNFFGDLKIEFTITGLNGTNNDFNAFLFGATPEGAFRFSLGERGSLNAKIEYGARRQYGFNEAPIQLNDGIAYHVTIIKEDGLMQLLLDNKLLVKKFYTLPIKAEQGSRFGFYSFSANLKIDDLRIYKKAVALSAKPTVVADAYLGEGFIENSIPAYRHVIEAYRNREISYEAHMKMGKALMVQKKYSEAIQNLTLAASTSKDSKIIPEALYQLAQCYFDQNMMAVGYEKLKLLPSAYPESELNDAAVESRVDAIYHCLDTQEKPETCAAKMVDEFRFLIQNEDTRRNTFGKYYIELSDIFRRLGQPAPMQNAQRMLTYFQENGNLAAAFRLLLARYYIGVNEEAKAGIILDAPQTENVELSLKAEKDFLIAQLAFLDGKNSKAADLYQKAYFQFTQTNGMAFKCMLHSLIIKQLVDIPVMQIDPKVWQNPTVSHNERMQLSYLMDKISEDYFLQSVSPNFGQNDVLEEVLVNFIKFNTVTGPTKAAAYLSSVLNRFASTSFEQKYLKFILMRFKDEKKV